MNKYKPEDVRVMFGDIVLEGFALGDFISVRSERLWYKTVEGKPFTVSAICEDYTQTEISFTEEGYDKHIKHMKPTLESPFKCVRL